MIRLVARWWWVAVLFLFIVCVAANLNGSSIGRWQPVLGENGAVRGLLLSTPKNIRFDEWAVWTPSILSQARQTPPFPIENPSLGYGRAPLLMSVPVAYYTTVFRPQLWGFFFLDAERGFSFYWCAKVFGLLLASAWLLRQVGIQHRGIIAFGTVWIFFSSFVQWWFSSPSMLPEMVASWAICVGCSIAFCTETKPVRVAVAAGAFVLCGINFVLCLYPPFQIPLVWLGVAVLIGIWLEKRRDAERFQTRRGLLLLGSCSAAVALVLIPFWRETWSTLELVGQTVYPGQRRSEGGGYAFWQLFDGAAGFFETEERVLPGFANVCEASNFYPLWPLALLGIVAARVRSRTPVPPLVSALTAVIVALSLYFVLPWPAWLLRASLLAYSYETRALLAIGLANVLLVCVFLDRYRQQVFSAWWSLGGALATAAALALLFHIIHAGAPAFFEDRTYLALLVATNALLAAMFFWDRARRWFPIAFASVLILSNGLINPIMRGLGPLTESAAYKQVEEIHAADPGRKWIAFDDPLNAQMVKATGAAVFNGTKVVPDVPLLRRLDTEGTNESVYNRYALLVCTLRVFPEVASFHLLGDDAYEIRLPPGLPILREAGYDYYLFPANWRDALFYDMALVARTPPETHWIYGRARAERSP